MVSSKIFFERSYIYLQYTTQYKDMLYHSTAQNSYINNGPTPKGPPITIIPAHGMHAMETRTDSKLNRHDTHTSIIPISPCLYYYH